MFKMKRETNPAAMTHMVPTGLCCQLISESDLFDGYGLYEPSANTRRSLPFCTVGIHSRSCVRQLSRVIQKSSAIILPCKS